MRGIEFAWRTGDPAIIDIHRFELDRGERVFVSGASGVGKSTLLSLISGVALPQHGEIRLLGVDIAGLRTASRDRFRADHLGIVFQLFNLVPYLTVMQNTLLPCRFSAERVRRLKRVGRTPEQEAQRLLDRLELPYRQLADRPVVELSIGQQQRVAVARALIGQPELIIADEPTSALDEAVTGRFVELLLSEAAAHETAVIFVSHDQRLADRFDRHVRFESLNRRHRPETAASPV